ncbi:MAG TPA: ABC transporter ATP-binding protein [Terriglobales bacterium]|nr:ABC transporter ATP-binding protein [Terriglobales bacterium]
MSTVIEARSVSKQFLLRHNASVELKVRFLGLLSPKHRQSVEEFWALKNVSLQIARGEAVGLIGRNGSGKSTFLKLIAAIHRPTSGRLLVARDARISSMIELGVGFHPELTGRENVFLNAAIHGLTSQETEAIYRDIVSYSGLEHFIDVPIKNFSSGMYMRLGFAVAAKLAPDILLLDEIFAVGDADFQQQCVETIRGFLDQGKTIVFVSHSPDAVRAICRRACVLNEGELAFDGDVEAGLRFYQSMLHGHGHGESVRPPVVARAAPIASSDVVATPNQGGTDPGGWIFDLLEREGLRRSDRVLHLGRASAAVTDRWLSFLQPQHYVRLVNDTSLFSLPAEAAAFDVAVADSVFPFRPFNAVAHCMASIVRRLTPSGRFYATWFENPDPANFEPIVQPGGITTFPDCEPYHYPFGLIASICDALGATVERLPSNGHPRGESLLVISRRR